MAPPSTTTPKLRTRVWIEHDGRFVVGAGGLRLLEALAERCSRRPGRSAGLYRHAWAYLKRAQAVLGTALVALPLGTGRRRGTMLTAAGRRPVETLAGVRRRLDALFGVTGPTPTEVAARGRGAGVVSRRTR